MKAALDPTVPVVTVLILRDGSSPVDTVDVNLEAADIEIVVAPFTLVTAERPPVDEITIDCPRILLPPSAKIVLTELPIDTVDIVELKQRIPKVFADKKLATVEDAPFTKLGAVIGVVIVAFDGENVGTAHVHDPVVPGAFKNELALPGVPPLMKEFERLNAKELAGY